MNRNNLSQSTLYRNCEPKEKGQFVQRELKHYLEHLHKMNSNHEYRQEMIKEKGDLLRIFGRDHLKHSLRTLLLLIGQSIGVD